MIRRRARFGISHERHLLTVCNPGYGTAAGDGLTAGMRAPREDADWLLAQKPIKVMRRTSEDHEVRQLALLGLPEN